MALTVVLSVGRDPDLMVTRNLVLQSAGYLVIPGYSIKEAVDRFQAGDFDLVLLCQSIPTKDKNHLISWIRASGSRVPVVSVTSQFSQEDAPAGVTVGSDPAALLWGVREILINTANPNAQSDAQGEKPPSLSTGYEPQTGTLDQHLVPLARTG